MYLCNIFEGNNIVVGLVALGCSRAGQSPLPMLHDVSAAEPRLLHESESVGGNCGDDYSQ